MAVEDIPKGWRKKKVGDFTDITSGGTPSTNISEYWGGSIRWMNSGELNDKKVYEVVGRITEEGLKNSSTKLLPKKCILIGLAGQGKTRGTVAMNFVELCINQSIGVIYPNESFIPEYLYYNLDSRYKELRNLSTGGEGRGGLNLSILRDILVLLPPLKEQKKIVKILSNVDENVEGADKIILSCEHIKKALMQTLLTKGIPGKHKKFRKTELGEIPEDWKVESLVNVSTILLCNVDKKSHSDEKSVRLCNYIDVYKNRYITNKINFMKATASDNEISKFGIQIGDVLITKDSETPDDIAVSSVVIEHIDNLVCGYHLALIRPKRDKLDSLFLMNLFSNEIIKNSIARKANGLTRFSLGLKTIQDIPILIPPLDEQKKIAQILTDLDERIQSEKTKKQQLIKLKTSLMQKLLSGEIMVRV